MIEDRFTHTEADAGLYERQRAQDDYDPPDVDWDACTCTYVEPNEDCPEHGRIACDRLFEVRDPRCFTEPPF